MQNVRVLNSAFCIWNQKSADCLVVRSIDQSIDWLIDFSIRRLLIDWLIDWLLRSRFLDWLIDWLTFLFTVCWLIDWLISGVFPGLRIYSAQYAVLCHPQAPVLHDQIPRVPTPKCRHYGAYFQRGLVRDERPPNRRRHAGPRQSHQRVLADSPADAAAHQQPKLTAASQRNALQFTAAERRRRRKRRRRRRHGRPGRRVAATTPPTHGGHSRWRGICPALSAAGRRRLPVRDGRDEFGGE